MCTGNCLFEQKLSKASGGYLNLLTLSTSDKSKKCCLIKNSSITVEKNAGYSQNFLISCSVFIKYYEYIWNW